MPSARLGLRVKRREIPYYQDAYDAVTLELNINRAESRRDAAGYA